MYKRRNKYNNIKIEIDGVKFDSKAEYKRFTELSLFQKVGNISELKKQVKFELQAKFKDNNGNNIRAIHYIADFTYSESGKFIVEDLKSKATAKDKVYILKKKMFLYKYPEYDFREVIK